MEIALACVLAVVVLAAGVLASPELRYFRKQMHEGYPSHMHQEEL